MLHQFGTSAEKDDSKKVSPHLPAFSPDASLSPYMPAFPNVPTRVAETDRLMTKEVFIANFKSLAEVYGLLSRPAAEQRNEKLSILLKDLQSKIVQIDLFTTMAIFGAFALYNHPEKADEVHHTESTLVEALDEKHANHAKLREWIWGLHWSLLHTMGGPNPVENKTKYTRRLTDHLFTALNQTGLVLDAKNNEVPPADHKFRPLFDKCVKIAKLITDDAYDIAIKAYLEFDAAKKIKPGI